jgi:hypothetical protein
VKVLSSATLNIYNNAIDKQNFQMNSGNFATLKYYPKVLNIPDAVKVLNGQMEFLLVPSLHTVLSQTKPGFF